MNAVRVSAPVRLDFAGAWSDVAPFATRERGVVVNATLALRAHAVITPTDSGYEVSSDDLGEGTHAPDTASLVRGGPLDLLCSALREEGAAPCRLRTWCEAPAGAGLGGSGALGVAIVGALRIARGKPLVPAAVAHRAWEIETVHAERAGGMQDQYAAAFGGFNHFTFADTGDGTTVARRAVQIDPGFLEALQAHTIICYTGHSRLSSDTIRRVMQAYSAGDSRVVAALRQLVALGDAMAEAMERGDLDRVGALLTANWRQQQELDDGMCTPAMAALEGAMNAAGALGGKAAGAGAGGSMFFVVRDPAAARTAAERAGVTVLPLQWTQQGVMAE
ncbi:MAG TPA: hypothetical protein VHW65_01745 [Gemmatimonadales bacterium]|jgi:D-glycero-alpha-D-manno-heptose-7-phosphate kinase|nr:hypothetical protein [Gemmatimonadales bacterium]